MTSIRSLRLKVSLWMLANFAVVAAGTCALLIWRFGFGWEALVQGPAGNGIERIAETIAATLRDDRTLVADEVLSRQSASLSSAVALFTSDGVQRAGAPMSLPPEVREVVLVGRSRGLRNREDGPPNQPDPDQRRQRDREAPPRDVIAIGRAFVLSENPRAYWVGVRIPVFSGPGPHRPGLYLVRIDSTMTLARILGLHKLLGLALGAAAASVILWLPLVGAMTRDLRRMHRATGRIASGHFETRVSLNRNDEFGGLAAAINDMAERLQSHAQRQKRFLGDVAHELGSPIACLQVLVGLLEARGGPGLAPTVDEVREEVERMASLVNELLMFTKADMRPRETELASLDLRSVVQATLRREGADGLTTVQIPVPVMVRADAMLLGRAIGNLVRNALRYAVNEGPIVISAEAFGDRQVRISVYDHGPGVPIEALARLGEAFYRPEIARTREGGGVGLGLAIVTAAIRACGGEVRFDNREPHGFLAEIVLARA